MSDIKNAYEAVLVERDGAIVLITMNRPDQRNALNRVLEHDLTAALEAVRYDASVRAVVLTGAGKGFCAGADLTSFGGALEGEQVKQHILTAYWPIVDLIISMDKPVIGAVNGVAAGAGCSIALACDLRVMAEDASLLQAFSNIGLVPDAGSSWLLARQIGYSRAYQFAIEGERLAADRCLSLGLANKVVAAGDLLEAACAWAHRLAARPTLALAYTKHLMREALTVSLEASVHHEADLQALCVESEDHTEGVMAFMQKREPHFTGR